jgi:hypothetical protein
VILIARTKNMKPKKPIESLIVNLRGQKVILDADLGELYGVPTYRFNEAFKRNRNRFPDDFAFQLTAAEFAQIRSKATRDDPQPVDNQQNTTNSSQTAISSLRGLDRNRNWSQFVTSSKKHRGAAYRPWAFTEHGAIMAATLLNSPEAVAMSVFVVRAFVQMREQLAANAAILKRLAEIDKTLLEHNSALRAVWDKLQPLLAPPPMPPKRRIGFKPDDK